MEELEITGGDSPEQNPQSESMPIEAEAELEEAPAQVVTMEAVEAYELLPEEDASGDDRTAEEDAKLKAVMEALVYVAEDPITVAQVAASLEQPVERIRGLLEQMVAEYDKPEHGIQIREVAGGYRMATKPEHHDAVRAFVKSLKPPLKLSLPALETLAVIAYKQPVTAPEIKEIRGVQGTGVLSTLLDRKLIAEAGRKNVIGKPILYKTTKEFLIQFGLKDLAELPTLKEFEEIRRMAFADSEPAEQAQAEAAAPVEAVEQPAAEGEATALEPAEVDAATPVEAEAAGVPVEAEAGPVEGVEQPAGEDEVAGVQPAEVDAEAPVEAEAAGGVQPAEEPATAAAATVEAQPAEEPEPAADPPAARESEG
jgi:segregation and condensation protein B